MRFDLDRLPTDPVLLQKMLREMAEAMEVGRGELKAARQTVKAQGLEIEKLEHRLARLLRVQFGRSSGKMDIRLDHLHTVFQAALAWTDSHLWELTFGRTGFGIPDPEYGFGGPLDARKTTLAQALEGMRGKTFRYLYDFGDAWEHSVKIQGIAPADPHGGYPRLFEAIGMRPPEDTGGPWGYAEKLEALADPTHEYHEEALDALGDDHDPDAQPDIDMIHSRFAALAKKWAPRPRKAK